LPFKSSDKFLALASLARACGELGGNKVGLGVPKIFQGVTNLTESNSLYHKKIPKY